MYWFSYVSTDISKPDGILLCEIAMEQGSGDKVSIYIYAIWYVNKIWQSSEISEIKVEQRVQTIV